MDKFLKEHGYKGVIQGTNLNQYSGKPIHFPATEEGAAKWNEIYQECLKSDLNHLTRGPKGSILHNIPNYRAYDVRTSPVSGVITISYAGVLYIFNIGSQTSDRKDNDKHLKAYEAFDMFIDKCEEFGIDLSKYEDKEGSQIKKTISKPYVHMFEEYIGKNVVLNNVNHIDFHSSYASGLVNTHPEFRPVVEFFYNGRAEHPEYKDVLNFTIGYMQSERVKSIGARYARLSKDSIEDNNKRIDILGTNILKNGGTIIGFNTDGIWYQGEVYHGEGEGPGICQWHNDYENCTFRAKSSGAYEFIDNKGKYHVKMRGYTKLDQVKPREEWQFGDIFKTEIEYLTFVEGVGFIKEQ